jgi:hypothetical protein
MSKLRKKPDEELVIPDDVQLHKALDDITKIEQVCRKALASGKYDPIQTMLLRSALRECRFAKASFVLNISHIKEDLESLGEWRDENLEEAPPEIPEEAE